MKSACFIISKSAHALEDRTLSWENVWLDINLFIHVTAVLNCHQVNIKGCRSGRGLSNTLGSLYGVWVSPQSHYRTPLSDWRSLPLSSWRKPCLWVKSQSRPGAVVRSSPAPVAQLLPAARPEKQKHLSHSRCTLQVKAKPECETLTRDHNMVWSCKLIKQLLPAENIYLSTFRFLQLFMRYLTS